MGLALEPARRKSKGIQRKAGCARMNSDLACGNVCKPQSDPWAFQILVTLLFAGLVFLRLTIPSHLYFDEIHYVPAARAMIAGNPANPEHPMLGKAMIAASIRLFGDGPLGWRLPSALCGIVGLWAFGRAMWLASGRAMASVAAMVLLATDFAWYVQSRIAMLDMVMAGLAMAALWMLAGAMAHGDGARWRVWAAGVALGLSLGAKWSVLPVWIVVAGRWPRGGGLGRRAIAPSCRLCGRANCSAR
jgi:dolichyl-phosphate-mannose--protein O-mannosyl transferase